MLPDKIKKLAESREQTAALEAEVAQEMKAALAALPAQFGFTKPRDFTDAVLSACRGKAGRPKKKKGAGAGATETRKARVTLTPELKASVLADLEKKITIREVAKTYGISTASVQNIKKSAPIGANGGKK